MVSAVAPSVLMVAGATPQLTIAASEKPLTVAPSDKRHPIGMLMVAGA